MILLVILLYITISYILLYLIYYYVLYITMCYILLCLTYDLLSHDLAMEWCSTPWKSSFNSNIIPAFYIRTQSPPSRRLKTHLMGMCADVQATGPSWMPWRLLGRTQQAVQPNLLTLRYDLCGPRAHCFLGKRIPPITSCMLWSP